eukprot:GHVU01138635.1.p1 GENE.GHVU01138635.1~~GHVU01138635.1.p1  ORF type:complete len:416 (+),score=92.52 GHVU01138635.1:63-1250(+)
MTERKVLNKYYPPDFDPEKLITRRSFLRNKGGGTPMMQVRMMMPFSMCCHSCGEFVYIGKKFNSKVERIKTEDYLGIAIWRFYGRCPNCRAEFAFKTDPKNTNYILEFGGDRTYEPIQEGMLEESAYKQKRKEMEEDADMKMEMKTYNTANELQGLEALDELRKINKRFVNVSSTTEKALQWLQTNKGDDDVMILSKEDENDLEVAKVEISRRKTKKEEIDLEEDRKLDPLEVSDSKDCSATIPNQSSSSSASITNTTTTAESAGEAAASSSSRKRKDMAGTDEESASGGRGVNPSQRGGDAGQADDDDRVVKREVKEEGGDSDDERLRLSHRKVPKRFTYKDGSTPQEEQAAIVAPAKLLESRPMFVVKRKEEEQQETTNLVGGGYGSSGSESG